MCVPIGLLPNEWHWLHLLLACNSCIGTTLAANTGGSICAPQPAASLTTALTGEAHNEAICRRLRRVCGRGRAGAAGGATANDATMPQLTWAESLPLGIVAALRTSRATA